MLFLVCLDYVGIGLCKGSIDPIDPQQYINFYQGDKLRKHLAVELFAELLSLNCKIV